MVLSLFLQLSLYSVSVSYIRYTPYFFDKHTLDSILEQSVDHHFHHLIQSRHLQRRRDVIDDNLAAEVIDDSADSLWEPPEVHKLENYTNSHNFLIGSSTI